MEIGTIRKGGELGRKGSNRSTKFRWSACLKCGKERWVAFNKRELRRELCVVCGSSRRAELNPNWKGGRWKHLGYIRVSLQPDDFFYGMVDTRGTLFEHRLVMARHIGRCLNRWEIVHHRNGIRDDNRVENLELVSDDRHKQITYMQLQVKRLKEKVLKLEVELCQMKQKSLS